MPKQRDAGGVNVGAHLIDTRFDDPVENVAQLAAGQILRIKSYAQILWFHFDQLVQRILQTPANGNGTAERSVMVGKLVASRLVRPHNRRRPLH